MQKKYLLNSLLYDKNKPQHTGGREGFINLMIVTTSKTYI